jgi:hypothetical protein
VCRDIGHTYVVTMWIYNNPAVATVEYMSSGTVNVFEAYVEVPHAGFFTSQTKAR